MKIDQPAATLWFHPHPHGDTARQIYMGLAGMMIVDDGSDARLGLPRTFGVDDLPLILQDRQFDSDGSIEYENKALGPLDIAYGVRGDTVIVNGAFAPVARVPAGQAPASQCGQRTKLRAAVQRSTHLSCHSVRRRFSPCSGPAPRSTLSSASSMSCWPASAYFAPGCFGKN